MPPPPAVTSAPAPHTPTSAPASPRDRHTTAAPTADGREPGATQWYTSQDATAAARRMARNRTVGDPACSLSATGQPDPHLLPRNGRIGIGHHGTYWCLIW
ncbi:hypothetical protein ABZX82_05990 [Streptomyces griseoflavus]|uniref:hypothetical protein n=1 Tax=Streptomyces griseoflavus TaxID=35619 RepID=UPI00167E626B|nr:hypothetical protein [Streptomyces griseoflavus]